MATLGILTCEILELELAHLLGTDPQVSQITVLAADSATRLMEALDSGGCQKLHRIPHIHAFSPEPAEGLAVLVRVMELALHRRKQTLQRNLVNAAQEMRSKVDALLLGYGLCGNALEDPVALLDLDLPLLLPRDGDRPVDDCVGLILGGRAPYYTEQRQVPGTFFMTPGWTLHWKKLFGANLGEVDVGALKRLFAQYERTLLVTTPVMAREEMRQRAAEFSRLLGLRVQERPGTLDLLNRAWKAAKASLERVSGP